MATLQLLKKATTSASTQCHDHALELCIPYITDTTTLLRVSLASHEQHAQVALHVQQQLPSVVEQTVVAGVQCLNRPDADEEQKWAFKCCARRSLAWVLSTAGPVVVGIAAVAETLLRLSADNPTILKSYQLPSIALKHGLQLTMQHLVDLSQQRVKFLHVWLAALGSRQRGLLWLQHQQQGLKQQDQDHGDGLAAA
jgi:hypothetical protein